MKTAWIAVAYGALAVLMTWPVAATLTRDLPGDLGDPVFVCWVIARASDHWLQLLAGDASAIPRFWQAGIFYPEPDATAFSEHFVLHALVALPVWALTRNVILCYNLLFIASFALSGLAMFLLARELTGRPRAAFVAGLVFAFLPYRMATLAHLQVLSSYWMPFALLGFLRFAATGRNGALAGGAAALWAQSLASGYYLVFFGPFLALFAVVTLWAYRRLTDVTAWAKLAASAVAVALATLPFALPYLRLQQRYGFRRSLQEVEFFSADLLAWFTAYDAMNLWGSLQALVRAEGFLFPGLTGPVFMLAGLIAAWRASRGTDDASARARVAAAFGTVAALIAFWLALGPNPSIDTQPIGLPSLYRVFYDYVPGYDVARVPSRFAMILFLIMAVAAGFALAPLDRSRWRVVLPLVGAMALADGWAAPLPMNRTWTTYPGELKPPEARIYPEREAPLVYRYLRMLPEGTVVAEFPFGLSEREIQYTYYSAVHRKPIVNGYSGAFPMVYQLRMKHLHRPWLDIHRAAAQLYDDGVTHVVVHTGAWEDDGGRRLAADFQAVGLLVEARFGDDVVLRLPR
ncbi:MAG: hypothetical protein AB1635_03400 [Acidobacteriota bacterium]